MKAIPIWFAKPGQLFASWPDLDLDYPFDRHRLATFLLQDSIYQLSHKEVFRAIRPRNP